MRSIGDSSSIPSMILTNISHSSYCTLKTKGPININKLEEYFMQLWIKERDKQ